MDQKHRLISDGLSISWGEEARRWLRHGGVWGHLKGEATDILLTLLRRPQSCLQAYPRTVNIEPTNYCNQKCIYCATGVNFNNRPRGKMDLATFQEIVADLPRTTTLVIAGFGEPFINENLEAFLEHAVLRGLSFNLDIHSNFGFISPDRIRGLLDYPFRRLIISLDAISRETFQALKGVDEFEQVWKNLSLLSAEARKRASVPAALIVQMIITRKNHHEQQRFLEAISRLRLIPCLKTLNTHSPRLSPEKIQELEVTELSRYRRKGYSRRCDWVWGGLQVYWNGDVAICCQDPCGLSTYGNIHQASARELLNTNPGRCEFRARYFENPGQIDICRRCDIS